MTKEENEFGGAELSVSRILLSVVPLLILLTAGLWYASTLIQPPELERRFRMQPEARSETGSLFASILVTL